MSTVTKNIRVLSPSYKYIFPVVMCYSFFFFFNLKFYLPWITGKETKTGTVFGKVSRVFQRG